MPWGAAIAAGGAILGGVIASNGSNKAANTQANAANAANAEQQREYDQTRADYAPYRESGAAALGHLNGLMANPTTATEDPSYAFGLNQGTQAISRSAAGAGGLYSGATLKALERYGQDYAGTKLNEQYNRYANIAGLGQVATGGTANAGLNAANQIGNNLTGLGSVQSANALNQGNIWGNVTNQLSSYGKQSGWWNKKTTDPGLSYGGYGDVQYGEGYGPQ